MFKLLRKTKLSILLLAAAILLIFLHYTTILVPAENLLIRIISPLQARIYLFGSGINDLYSSRFNVSEIKSENEKLNQAVTQLTTENAGLKVKLEENLEQAKQCKFAQAAALESIPAMVIGKNPEPNLQSIILNKGEADGVAVGLPVISDSGIIVGKILYTKKNSSEAIIISDSRSQIAATILNESSSRGVVAGEHGLSLKMELIPKNEIVKEGDVVITSGTEAQIPRGLVIGKVSRIISEPNTFFQTAYLQSLVKLDSLTIVSVVKNQNHE
ncbi:MAG: rod shape-determining protein MreC [Candidatus Buchananbacteria bacterium]